MTGFCPEARMRSVARDAGQCHTLYMMPMRLHGVLPSACEHQTRLQGAVATVLQQCCRQYRNLMVR